MMKRIVRRVVRGCCWLVVGAVVWLASGVYASTDEALRVDKICLGGVAIDLENRTSNLLEGDGVSQCIFGDTARGNARMEVPGWIPMVYGESSRDGWRLHSYRIEQTTESPMDDAIEVFRTRGFTLSEASHQLFTAGPDGAIAEMYRKTQLVQLVMARVGNYPIVTVIEMKGHYH